MGNRNKIKKNKIKEKFDKARILRSQGLIDEAKMLEGGHYSIRHFKLIEEFGHYIKFELPKHLQTLNFKRIENDLFEKQKLKNEHPIESFYQEMEINPKLKDWVRLLTLLSLDQEQFNEIALSNNINGEFNEITSKCRICESLQQLHSSAEEYFGLEGMIGSLLEQFKETIDNLLRQCENQKQSDVVDGFAKINKIVQQIFNTKCLVPINLKKPFCMPD